MAFGLFRKKQTADVIFTNGVIKTRDPEYPEAQAVAVKDGLVLAAGDAGEIADLKGKDTEVIDLGGKFMTTGRVELDGSLSAGSLAGSFIKLDESMNEDALLAAVTGHLAGRPDADHVLGIGYAATSLSSSEEDIKAFRTRLDEISGEIPVVLIARDDLYMRVNTAAAQIAAERAEEMGRDTITPAFIMDSVISIDLGRNAEQLMESFFELAKRGVTSVYNNENSVYLSDLFSSLLMSAYDAQCLKLRVFDSFPIRKRMNQQSILFSMDRKATFCQELAPFINFTTLDITFSSEEDSDCYMDETYIRELAEAASDKGYSVRFEPLDRQAALLALETASDLAGSNKKAAFTVKHGFEFTSDELASIATGDAIELPLKDENLAAAALGTARYAESIAPGAWADFVITKSENDPEAVMTVLGGKVVYEAGKDVPEAWKKAFSDALGELGDEFAEDFGEEAEEPEE
jgi:hypothetical protein